MKHKIFLMTIVAFLFACQQSPQKSYYLLSPDAAGAVQNNQEISSLVGLGPIELADYLNRPNMVRMSSDNTLILTSSDYWAEPLDKGIVRVLALNLTNRNPSRMVQIFPWRSDSVPAYSVRLHINEWVVVDGKAKMNASWELVETRTKQTKVRKHFVHSVKSGSGADAMAEAYSKILSHLSDEMHQALEKVEK